MPYLLTKLFDCFYLYLLGKEEVNFKKHKFYHLSLNFQPAAVYCVNHRDCEIPSLCEHGKCRKIETSEELHILLRQFEVRIFYVYLICIL